MGTGPRQALCPVPNVPAFPHSVDNVRGTRYVGPPGAKDFLALSNALWMKRRVHRLFAFMTFGQ